MLLAKQIITSLKQYYFTTRSQGLLGILQQNCTRTIEIAIGRNNYITSPVKFEKGILQSDCLTQPLLVDICFNTLIKCISQEKIKLFGYSYCNTLQPRHWFQFADDTAITTAAVEELANWQNTWEKIHRLPLHPRNKLELISKHAYGKFRWRFSISCRKNG